MSALSRPLVVAFFALLGGLLAALRFGAPPLPWLLAAGAAGVCALAVARRPAPPGGLHPGDWLILASLFCGGVALGGWGRAVALTDCRAVIPNHAPVIVRGVLAANAAPLADTSRSFPPALPLETDQVRVGGTPVPGCEGQFRVRLPASAAQLRAGTVLKVSGQWRRMRAQGPPSPWPRNPRFRGTVRADTFKVLAEPALLRNPLLTLRGRTENHLYRLFPAHGALADALLLGRREGLDPQIQDRFTRSGLVHLLAISGSHVALLAAGLFLLGSVLGALLGFPRRWLPWLVIGVLAGYLALIGAPASAMRAGIMVALALLAGLLQRPSASLPIVAAAAAVLLAIDPLAALDPGFQLSFAGVLGIVAFRGVLLRGLPVRWRTGRRRYLTEGVAVSVAAFAATAPITAHHFGSVAPIAVVANLPAIPLTSLALIGVVVSALVEPVLPPLGRLIAGGTGLVLDLLDRVAGWAARVPFGHASVPEPQWPLWAAAAVVLLLALDGLRRLRPRIRWTVAVASTVGFVLAWPVLASPRAGGLELHFLDVGQGDALAIRTPGGRWLLVDAGPRDDRYDAGASRVVPFLRAHGARRLAALILTHPHADHIGGAPAVMQSMPTERLVEPGLPVGSPVYLETLREAERSGTEYVLARRGRTLEIDGVTLEFLWPNPDALDDVEDANKISAVIRLRYGNSAALLVGDAGEDVEGTLVTLYGEGLRAQVLKVGHHGSRTSSSELFLETVRPELAVVSAGRRNFYGHPTPEALARLANVGAAIARTDREGDVSLRSDGRSWQRIRQ